MTSNPFESNIENILNNQLCDFQKATVDYLYKRMMVDGQNRMLVADEVGLGKTWIAKGLVAKIFKSWYDEREKSSSKTSFNVFYICSNQSLAGQNLVKLNFGNKDSVVANVDRLTMFAIKPNKTNSPYHLYALTPDTSFNSRSTQGIKLERYIIYLLLKNCGSLNSNRLRSFLKGSGNYEHDNNIKESDLRNGLSKTYQKMLTEETFSMREFSSTYAFLGIQYETTLMDILIDLCNVFDRRKTQPSFIFNEVIGELKRVLIKACMRYMDADIFIMDEFQRYSKLIEIVGLSDKEYEAHGHSESDSIARGVFNNQYAKVLMLSATPFKAFTNEVDEIGGEIHFKEFMKVLKFLYQGCSVDWKELERNRRLFFSAMLKLKDVPIDRRDDYIEDISTHKDYLESVYSKVMVRTEKIIASNDANGMTHENPLTPIKVTSSDIKDFINLDHVFKNIYEKDKEHAPAPLDYAKSAPFAMSFLRDYKVWEKAGNHKGELSRLFNRWKSAFVDLGQINRYEFDGYTSQNGRKDCPNGKLKMLMRDLNKNAMLLWCPPSLPYYPLVGAFRGRENFTKTLIFSAWKLVPKMVSTMVSYEVEKNTIGKYDPRARYFANKNAKQNEDIDQYRRPRRQLQFQIRNKVAVSMTTLLLAYPSVSLSKMYDPVCNMRNGFSIPRVKDIIHKIQKSISGRIKEIVDKGKGSEYDTKSDNTAINWILPIRVDISNGLDSQWINKVRTKDNESGVRNHLKRLTSLLEGEESVGLPSTISENVKTRTAQNIACLVIGSPAICAYRTLQRYFKDGQDTLLALAMQIGLSFIDMFNKPESIAVVGLSYRSQRLDYWEKVIRYCADGCLQSVLDEYVFMLLNDYHTAQEVTDVICSQLSTRTGTLIVDDKESFGTEDDSTLGNRKRMRTHYAMPFGIQARTGSGVIRSSSVRSAFNSPFRPFVLTTTSIGQEGLDFHYYCREVIHWNLPNNPIDLEQREGRINRYRGKVIRQRIADKYWKELSNTNSPWHDLFDLAAKEKSNARFECDIVPNWHIEAGNSNAWIERKVPLFEFSQDIEKYELMKKALGKYRLAFGQPRQEELIEAIDDNLSEEEKEKLLIDLAPIKK